MEHACIRGFNKADPSRSLITVQHFERKRPIKPYPGKVTRGHVIHTEYIVPLIIDGRSIYWSEAPFSSYDEAAMEMEAAFDCIVTRGLDAEWLLEYADQGPAYTWETSDIGPAGVEALETYAAIRMHNGAALTWLVEHARCAERKRVFENGKYVYKARSVQGLLLTEGHTPTEIQAEFATFEEARAAMEAFYQQNVENGVLVFWQPMYARSIGGPVPATRPERVARPVGV